MKKEDVLYAKGVYEKIIKTQVFNPKEVIKAYKQLHGIGEDILVNQLKAKQALFAFFYYGRDKQLFPDIEQEFAEQNKPVEEKKSEVTTQEQDQEQDQEEVVVETTQKQEGEDEDLTKLYEEIIELEKQKGMTEDTNEKRSLAMKINHIKRRIKQNE